MERPDSFSLKIPKFNGSTILFALILLPFFEIDALWGLTGSAVHMILSILSMLIISLLLFRTNELRLDKLTVCYIVYAIIVLASSAMRHTLSIGMIYSFLLVFFLLATMNVKFEWCMSVFSCLFGLIIIINFISMFYFQEIGYYAASAFRNQYCGIVGGRNSFAVKLLPMALIIFYNCMRKNKRDIYPWIMLLLAVGMCVFSKSATGISVAIIVLVLFLCRKRLKIDFFSFVAGVAGVNILLIFFLPVITDSQLFINYLGIVNRNITFSSRTSIWKEAVEMIRHSWIIGYGRGVSLNVNIYGMVYKNFTGAHNSILQLLLNGGVLGVAAYSKAFMSAMPLKHVFTENEKIILIGIIAIFIIGLMESVQDINFLWILLSIMRQSIDCGDRSCNGEEYV